jgi:hypothetical protein
MLVILLVGVIAVVVTLLAHVHADVILLALCVAIFSVQCFLLEMVFGGPKERESAERENHTNYLGWIDRVTSLRSAGNPTNPAVHILIDRNHGNDPVKHHGTLLIRAKSKLIQLLYVVPVKGVGPGRASPLGVRWIRHNSLSLTTTYYRGTIPILLLVVK